LSACVEPFDALTAPSDLEGLRRDVVGFPFSIEGGIYVHL